MLTRRGRAIIPVFAVLLLQLAGILLSLGSRRRFAHRVRTEHHEFEPALHLSGVLMPRPVQSARRLVVGGGVLILLIGVGIYMGYQMKFEQGAHDRAVALTTGNPDAGRHLARRYGCAGCHTIPGIPAARGRVGPSLQGFAARIYIAGVATNSPDTLIQWIENPRSLNPKTAMPVTGISRDQARHVAAYLYTLR